MQETKINPKKLRRAAVAYGFDSIVELATAVPCNRGSIYQAIQRPHVFPRVKARIKELINVEL